MQIKIYVKVIFVLLLISCRSYNDFTLYSMAEARSINKYVSFKLDVVLLRHTHMQKLI